MNAFLQYGSVKSRLYSLVVLVGLFVHGAPLLAENYVPVRYKFEPLPKYEELRKPAKGRGTYLKDPNVWVYTRAFAERFGMPEKWVDESLEGAEAVAYRVEASTIQSCGYFGEIENCRARLSCVFDLYLGDKDSAKLPWESHKSADWQGWESSSTVFLPPQVEEDYWYWTDEVQNKRYVRLGATGLRSVVFVEGPPSKTHDWVFSGQGPMYMRAYRRDFFKGLDLLELKGCMVPRADKPVRIYFLDPLPDMDDPQYRLPDGRVNRSKLDAARKKQDTNMDAGTPPHKVKLPDAYMDNVRAHDKAERHGRSLAAKAWRRFKGSEVEQAYQEERKQGLWSRFVHWMIE